ncbi:MAG: DUF6328 family protein [Actinomycetota bacterium]
MADEKHEESEKLHREFIELLNELRVVLPGVQVLFAFLLIVPFSEGFGKLTDLQRGVFLGSFLTTAAATVFLMAPTANHRMRWRRHDKERLLQIANRLAISGIALLGLAVSGVTFLVTDVLLGTPLASVIAGAIAALLIVVWFVVPLSMGNGE